jgi:calcineurin-like phosphoesterase family protein
MELSIKMSRKQIFFSSDWHIGHANSIVFDKRPFNDLDHMHRTLVSNFNKKVPVGSLTYFLGDMATHSASLTKTVMDQLNGIKILVVGNHDKNYESCYNAGFDVVMNQATIYIQKQRVTLSHCPLLGVFRENTSSMKGTIEGELWHGESRHKRFSVADTGQFHLHGHIHSPNGEKSERILGRQFDVGLPGNKYRPVHVSEIESFIMRYLNDNISSSTV